jgi:ferritin-like metal-binding protein YciE
MRPLDKVFWDEMAEMLHIKELLLKALLRMNAAASRPALKEAMNAYRSDVEQQAKGLKELFKSFEMFAREKKSDGMMGLLVKGQQIMQRTGQGPALDAALLSQCRKITAYNLACYCTLASWAKLLMPDDGTVTTLKQLLRTEIEAGLRFSRLSLECDAEAAGQTVESVRRPSIPVRKLKKALPDFARWDEG